MIVFAANPAWNTKSTGSIPARETRRLASRDDVVETSLIIRRAARVDPSVPVRQPRHVLEIPRTHKRDLHAGFPSGARPSHDTLRRPRVAIVVVRRARRKVKHAAVKRVLGVERAFSRR